MHQRAAETSGGLRVGLRRRIHERRDDEGGYQRHPNLKYRKQNTQQNHDDSENAQAARFVLQPHAFGFDIDVEIRNDDKRDHHQARHQHAGDDRREVVQHLLQAEEVPRRLRRIRRVHRIGEAFQRRIPEKRG